jgi:hypothetical protein
MVATTDAVEAGKPGDWIEFHNHDRSLSQETGNDHLSFTGKLDATLVFRLGPILGGACRVEDLQDMERLRIRQARAAPEKNAPR